MRLTILWVLHGVLIYRATLGHSVRSDAMILSVCHNCVSSGQSAVSMCLSQTLYRSDLLSNRVPST